MKRSVSALVAGRASCLPLLLGIALFAVLWSTSPWFSASDPWAYSRNAYRIVEGTFFESAGNHPFSQRLGVLLPVAFFYSLFGVDLLTTNLWPLCAAIMIIVVVWFALPSYTARVVSILLCVTSWTLFRASITLYPDVVAAAFMSLSCLFLSWRAHATESGWRRWVYPVLVPLFWFAAFLAKLAALWVTPLWLGVLARDLRQGNRSLLGRFHIPAVATGILLGALYLMACEILWNDPLVRLKGVAELAGRHEWAGDAVSLRRLTVGPAGLFLREYGIVAVLAFCGLLVMPKRAPFWTAYTLSTAAFFWLGPTSLDRYQPLPLFWRETLPILPGILVLASLTVTRLYELPSPFRKPARILCVLLVGAAVWPFLEQVRSFDRKRPEVEAMRVVREEAERDSERRFLLACSDARSPEFLAFYFGYQYPANLTVAAVGDIDRRQLAETDKAFVFVHRQRSARLRKLYDQEHYDWELAALELQPRFRGGGVFLFETSDASELLPALRRVEAPEDDAESSSTPRRAEPEAAWP